MWTQQCGSLTRAIPKLHTTTAEGAKPNKHERCHHDRQSDRLSLPHAVLGIGYSTVSLNTLHVRCHLGSSKGTR